LAISGPAAERRYCDRSNAPHQPFGGGGRPASTPQDLGASGAVAFTGVIREWRQRARSRRELLALDDHMLKDIGITRVDALYEVAKPFWC
jgi:uncharacterized protein YjiS (DUF1127 family)